MANPDPDLYTISVGVKPVFGTLGRERPLCAALSFDVTSRPFDEKSQRATVKPVWDGHSLVVRPGDYVQLKVGCIGFPVQSKARLRVEWKALDGREWPDAPVSAEQPAQVPPNAGFDGKRFSFRPVIALPDRLDTYCDLTREGNTVIGYDPDMFVDEC